jgi:hypothetical protein
VTNRAAAATWLETALAEGADVNHCNSCAWQMCSANNYTATLPLLVLAMLLPHARHAADALDATIVAYCY